MMNTVNTTTTTTKPRRRGRKAAKVDPHVSVAEVMDRVMQATVAEFLRTLLRDEEFLGSGVAMEGEAMEEKVAEAMKVWCDMTHKPKGMSFLSYPIGLYAAAPSAESGSETGAPAKKKKTAYQNFCGITRPLLETGDFVEKTREVARLWNLLSKEEKLSYRTTDEAEAPVPAPAAAAAEPDETQVPPLAPEEGVIGLTQVDLEADLDAEAEDANEDTVMTPDTVWVSVAVDYSTKENQAVLSSNEKNLWKELIKLSKTELEERIRGDRLEHDAFKVPEGMRGPKILEKSEKQYLANVIMNARRPVVSRPSPSISNNNDNHHDEENEDSHTFSDDPHHIHHIHHIHHPDRPLMTWTTTTATSPVTTMERTRSVETRPLIEYTDPAVYLTLDKQKADMLEILVKKSSVTLSRLAQEKGLLVDNIDNDKNDKNDNKENSTYPEETDEFRDARRQNRLVNVLMNHLFPIDPSLPPPTRTISVQKYPPVLPLRFVEFDEDLIHECKYNPRCDKILADYYEIHRELRVSHLEHILQEHRILYPAFRLPSWATSDRSTELRQEYLLQILLNAREWEMVEDHEKWLDYHRRVYYYLSWDEKDAGKPLEPRCKCSRIDLTHWDSLYGSMRGSSLETIPEHF